eukprot:8488420-Pyramimonas_sp.AAC.1
MPCCAWSRDSKNCRGAADGCNKERRGLADAEKLKRDKWEQAKLGAGQSLEYERTAANVSSSRGDGGSRAFGNNSDKRKKDGDKHK